MSEITDSFTLPAFEDLFPNSPITDEALNSMLEVAFDPETPDPGTDLIPDPDSLLVDPVTDDLVDLDSFAETDGADLAGSDNNFFAEHYPDGESDSGLYLEDSPAGDTDFGTESSDEFGDYGSDYGSDYGTDFGTDYGSDYGTDDPLAGF
ncbi:hypothetical protein [Corynebacterium aquatimens]|uniref:Uncharacterized protein n=1 Tax=Corynebacterium aquatimens TaxID=1190508 RepID=A0A931DXW7_9CORY|nr:hypothetical protein [Corynebacterium aquatimens]MBG6122135.1 hypothetical protein [Corynebacterium aquatimens]WJY65324.1 hypothetical protein CAQUA_03035 [Corynebacterium aquatimens]